MINLNQNPRLVIFHREQNTANSAETVSGQNQLLRFALDNKLSADTIISSLNAHVKTSSQRGRSASFGKTLIAMPEEWSFQTEKKRSNILPYHKDLQLPKEITNHSKKYPWLIVTNARFVTTINYDWLERILCKLNADVVAIEVDPQLQAGHNKTLVTNDNKIVGFRRYYENTAELVSHKDSWPDLLFIKTDVLSTPLFSDKLCLSFSSFVEKCHSNSLCFRTIKAAGEILDMDTRDGLLKHLSDCTEGKKNRRNRCCNGNNIISNGRKITIPENAILTGKVFLDQNVTIGQNAVIIGPALIGDNAVIEQDVIIKRSIIGPGVNIKSKQFVDNQIVVDNELHTIKDHHSNRNGARQAQNRYRVWPKFSYVRFLKRLADIGVAIMVLILFAPILFVVALVVKASSPGPIFYKDQRQGLHGKPFDCLKFRTMMVGADEIQGKLRSQSQVDGPQFKMENDPRVNKIGEFLRDTYLDEIPQFFNVLVGQMSVVGPRPSPETENTLCTYWRDARLSVRPGITGLWQVNRSRQTMKDFQEWIFYDTKYVRDMSLRLDIWICWKTFKQMVMKFVSKF